MKSKEMKRILLKKGRMQGQVVRKEEKKKGGKEGWREKERDQNPFFKES